MLKIEIKDFLMQYRDLAPLPCVAPCSMYSVLLDHGKIEDPFYRKNAEQLTDYSSYDTVFVSTVEVNASTLSKKHVLLRFFGLDTLCKIELNGTEIAKTDNMHRTFLFDVKNQLHVGKNELKLTFYGALKEMEKRQKDHPLRSDGNAIIGSSHLRKANFMSGWDWAPKLPDMGIFRPIDLIAFDEGGIDSVGVIQRHQNRHVFLDISLETYDGALDGEVTLFAPDGKKIQASALQEGKATLFVENPLLWWPNGLGEQPLYSLRVVTKEDKKELSIGLRTLTVSNQKDEIGKEFSFTVNGRKFFAMGADYIPEDSLITRMSRERTEKLVKDSAEAHFNVFRVWGGGIYPSDDFFDLCDRYGIVVWQDYMVACSNVWMKYKENYVQEFIDNIRRIRTHACLGLICGNNEVEMALQFWGYNDGQEVLPDYIELFENQLPALCKKYAPDLFYWPSSPSSGGRFENTTDENCGDTHYWDIWHGGQPYKITKNHQFRFCSEFGFQSIPSLKTIKTVTLPKDRNLFSPVMEFHQKNREGNVKMLSSSAIYYRYAESFESLIYLTQLIQSDAVAYAVEHMRRHRGRCMGAIYWQLNDCWPVSSWSGIDYYGRWKGLHYRAKRFFAPILLSVAQEKTSVTVNISNETNETLCGTVRYELRTNDCQTIFSRTVPVTVEPFTAQDCVSYDFVKETEAILNQCYVVAIYEDEKRVLKSDNILLVESKEYEFEEPQIVVSVEEKGEQFELTLTSKKMAKTVKLELQNADARFSDNWFDLGGEEKHVLCTPDRKMQKEQIEKRLTVYSVYNIGR